VNAVVDRAPRITTPTCRSATQVTVVFDSLGGVSESSFIGAAARRAGVGGPRAYGGVDRLRVLLALLATMLAVAAPGTRPTFATCRKGSGRRRR
jgi:hypothetical protein